MPSSESEDADVRAVAAKRAQLNRPLFNATNAWSDDEQDGSPAPAQTRARPRRVAHFLGADDDGDQVRLDGGEDILDDLFGDLRDVTNGGAARRREEDEDVEAGHVTARDAAADAPADGDDVDAVVKKARKPRAKLDEFRLVSSNGLPALLRDVQRFKARGKGQERSDLKRVITMYQLWAHQMFPRTNVRDTLKAVEKLCHKQSVKRMLKELREEAKTGKRKDGAIQAESGQTDAAVADQSSTIAPPHQRDAIASLLPQNRLVRPTRDEFEDVDLFADEDELFRELEAQAFTTASIGLSGDNMRAQAAPQTTTTGDLDEDLFADEDELLRELEEQALQPAAVASRSGRAEPESSARQQQPSLEDTDDEAEAAMRELENDFV
ncbi:hypothetical protein ACM66B_004830 [Microbotryomycetes sp. NB124-2]